MGSIATAPLSFNLLLGRPYPHSAQDLDEAKQLCHELGLGPLLERMPAGLDQIVGETGWQLSQGERGRVSLARALLQNAEVVMLDESLGALDPQNSQAMPGLCDSEGKDTSGGGTSMNTERAVKLQDQGWNLEAEGKLDEAAIAVRKALLLLQESDEANSPDAANLLNDLAEIESERQSFQDALVLAERAHSIEDQLGDGFAG